MSALFAGISERTFAIQLQPASQRMNCAWVQQQLDLKKLSTDMQV
jgi:hypothetical protein